MNVYELYTIINNEKIQSTSGLKFFYISYRHNALNLRAIIECWYLP